MRGKLKVRVVRSFDPDPEAVLRAIAAIIKFSDERRALREDLVGSGEQVRD